MSSREASDDAISAEPSGDAARRILASLAGVFTGGPVDRRLIAVASCLMQVALGSVYASSVLLVPMMERYGVSEAGANLSFTITILTLGITAGFGGALQHRFGPRAVATAGGVLYGIGVGLAGFAPSILVVYVTYGIIGGIGLGLCYIVPLAMLIRWFPDQRGRISGIAVAGFGAGAMIVAPLATWLIGSVGINASLMTLGTVYFIVITGLAQLFRAAPDGYAPPSWTPSALRAAIPIARRNATLAEALRSPIWYLLWLVLALNVTAGAALISVAAPLAEEFSSVPATTAALAVMAISLTNGIGRPFWGWVSDEVGRPLAFAALFLIQFLAFCLLAQVENFELLLVLAALIGMCFGGGFAVMPAFAADFFGSRNAGAIYGAMLTAWGVGAVAGPMLIASIDYRSAAWIIACIMLGSTPLALCAGWNDTAARLRLARARPRR